MIFCKKSNLNKYSGINKNLDTAIQFIISTPLAELAMGRNAVDGENVFINRFDYETKEASSLLYESHLKYADLHLILSGQEKILVAPQDSLNFVEENKLEDYVGLQGEERAAFNMDESFALIVFPHEAHKVKCIWDKPAFVKKAVVKILIEN
ncbi:MAG: DUF386 family protein [Christensenellaceae bacterium]|nr:DUF386 family protein [Christensenellaceae bacterium]